MRVSNGASVGELEIREFRNCSDFRHTAQESTRAFKAVESALQELIDDDAEQSVASMRLGIAHRAREVEAALPLIESLLERMKTAAGPKALKQAAERVRFLERDGSEVPRPGAVA